MTPLIPSNCCNVLYPLITARTNTGISVCFYCSTETRWPDLQSQAERFQLSSCKTIVEVDTNYCCSISFVSKDPWAGLQSLDPDNGDAMEAARHSQLVTSVSAFNCYSYVGIQFSIGSDGDPKGRRKQRGRIWVDTPTDVSQLCFSKTNIYSAED
ncbi:uncharacterized protein [Venturia canescens]|uniref:uncharacterized protein n=1 Tax=Venturia canescens TaxID=32260 RepID=UPI001C9BD6C8|nr:uncharacterized protein LOC122419097 [Venturia canescens]